MREVRVDNLQARFDDAGVWLELIDLSLLAALCLVGAGVCWDIVRKRWEPLREKLANIAVAIGNILLERTLYGAVFLIALWLVEPLAWWRIPVNGWTWALALLAADLSYYWMHRIEHKVRFFWTIHSAHHSSERFDFSTSLRLSWLEGPVEWIFLVPMVLLGFDLVQTIVAFLAVVAYQSWIHTEKVGTLGWLDRVFNTPSAHRVHHGSHHPYLDKNFGGVLMLWDRLFGTYQPETAPVSYGLTTPLASRNPFIIVFHEAKALYSDCRNAHSWRDRLHFLIKSPGWKPDTHAHTDH
ncbi:Sterol desaturase [Hahella chejuensis KCTC 2396]|uniref:Sterol desaturase n=1 Tax=Hahella chejuensis (strain KCTC 2396) TaxID=349521 RepID=Q2SE79_HAHCH|nr:Sterol desaturase [Hahella chejuensis KCTC 2396]